jgi:Aerotolerance regulator N-terminal
MIELVHPLWLWGLLSLVIPVLLHKHSKKTVPPVDFPPVALFPQQAQRFSKLRKIGDIFRLLLQCFLLTAIVFAFAGLRYQGSGSSSKLNTSAALLVIDDSRSMNRPFDPKINSGPSRLGQCQLEAARILGSMSPGSEAAVIFASGRSIGPDRPERIARQLGQQQRGMFSQNISSALNAVSSFSEVMAPLKPDLWIWTDCEVSKLQPADILDLKNNDFPGRVFLRDAGRMGVGNDWAILSVACKPYQIVAGQKTVLKVRLQRLPGPGKAAESRKIELLVGGLVIASKDVRLQPGELRETNIEFQISRGFTKGLLRLSGNDNWAGNDAMPVSLYCPPVLKCLVISEKTRFPQAGKIISLALSPGPGKIGKSIHCSSYISGMQVRHDFSKYDLAVLHGPPQFSSLDKSALARAVASGMGLLILAESGSQLNDLAFSLGLATALVNGRSIRFEKPAWIVPNGKGVELLKEIGNWTSVPVFRRMLKLVRNEAEILAWASSENGQETLPLLLEWQHGQGAVLVMTSGLSSGYSDLLQTELAGLLVPMLNQLAYYVAGRNSPPVTAFPGQLTTLRLSSREKGASIFLEDGVGLRAPLGIAGGGDLFSFSAPETLGAYRLSSELDGKTVGNCALTVRSQPTELRGQRDLKLADLALELDPDQENLLASRAISKNQQTGGSWWWALIALGLLVLEMVIGFRSDRRDSRNVPEVGTAQEKRGGVVNS